MATAFEILVGGRANYAAHPGSGALVIESDGKVTHCALGALGKAGGCTDEEMSAADALVDYDDVLDDKNGIDLAIRLLAEAIARWNVDRDIQELHDWAYDEDIENPTVDGYIEALRMRWAGDKAQMYEVVHEHNDTFTAESRKFDHTVGSYVYFDVEPAPEVLEVFDAAIEVAGKL